MSKFLNIIWYLTSILLIVVILIQNPKAEGAGVMMTQIQFSYIYFVKSWRISRIVFNKIVLAL